MKTCPHCHEDPGDGPRCEHCGEMLFRYATDEYASPSMPREDDATTPPPAASPAPPPGPTGDPFAADPFASTPTPLPSARPTDPYETSPAPVAAPTDPFGGGGGPRLSVPRTPRPVVPDAGKPAKQGSNGCAIAAMILGGIVVLAVIGLFFLGRSLIENAEEFLDLESVPLGSGREINWSDVEVGDCIIFIDAVQEGDDTLVSTLERVDCLTPHDAEIYALFDLAGNQWPGPDAVYLEGDGFCYDRFEEYVGIDYMESYYFYEVYSPTAVSWEAGDRTVACTLIDPSGMIEKPLRGSGE